jgi:hypothetical protein
MDRYSETLLLDPGKNAIEVKRDFVWSRVEDIWNAAVEEMSIIETRKYWPINGTNANAYRPWEFNILFDSSKTEEEKSLLLNLKKKKEVQKM